MPGDNALSCLIPAAFRLSLIESNRVGPSDSVFLSGNLANIPITPLAYRKQSYSSCM